MSFRKTFLVSCLFTFAQKSWNFSGRIDPITSKIQIFILEEEEAEMSDEVAVTTSEAPAEIIPAKSEDKLEIEKEEAEQKEAEENKDTDQKESVEG